MDDYREARSIVGRSPRGATALLRLVVQKLVAELSGMRDLNEGIGTLVKGGMPVQIQKSLDLVRVVGNSAVHPGTIDMKDNAETAMSLFRLVNVIVQDRITQPREIATLYDKLLTPGQKEQIKGRDGTTEDTAQTDG